MVRSAEPLPRLVNRRPFVSRETCIGSPISCLILAELRAVLAANAAGARGIGGENSTKFGKDETTDWGANARFPAHKRTSVYQSRQWLCRSDHSYPRSAWKRRTE